MIQRLGYDAATITDHDFISQEQVQRARAAANTIPFITGIELSSAHQGQTVHILGFFVDPQNLELQEYIQKAQDVDRTITEKMLKFLPHSGIQIDIDDLISHSLHTYYSMRLVKWVAAELFNNNPSKTLAYFIALHEKIGINYADFSPWSVQQAIELIHQANGIAVLAHPGGAEDKVMRKLDFYYHDKETIEQYLGWGLDGIETHSPVHNHAESKFYVELADHFGLLKTAGSDCHGDDPYLGPSLMDKFTDLYDDQYEKMVQAWKKNQIT